MLAFPESRIVTLYNFQARNETHGKDLVPAVDLGVSIKGSNRLLDLIHAQLRPALFKAGQQDSGAEPELNLEIDELPHVRVPRLSMPLRVDYEQTGMSLEIAYGTARKPSNIVLGLVKLSKVRIEALAEGGSVELRFTLSCANEITETIAGRLAMLQGHDIEMKLEGPQISEDQKPTEPAGDGASKADPGNDPAWPFPNDKPAPTTPEEAFAGTAEAAGAA